MALAAAGLLKNRRAVTHRAALADLCASGARVEEARVVDDGELVTCGGVTSSLDLALHLVSRLSGSGAATQIAQGMEYTPSADVYIASRTEEAS
jgi:transcriptional regulator GlxA family with amidase domain